MKRKFAQFQIVLIFGLLNIPQICVYEWILCLASVKKHTDGAKPKRAHFMDFVTELRHLFVQCGGRPLLAI